MPGCGLEAPVRGCVPGLAQVGDVGGQIGVGGILGIGAQDEAAAGIARKRGHALAQLLAQIGRADLLRDADAVVLRQVDQQPPGDADLGGQPRALGADGVLDHLHGERLAFVDEPLDRQGRHGTVAALRAVIAALRSAVRMQVGHMQKGGALEPDVDEGRLHARQDSRDAPRVDVADQAALQRAFDVQFLHGAVFDDGHARLLRRPIDQDVLHSLAVQKRTPNRCSSSAVS